jgi:hypothetical protein
MRDTQSENAELQAAQAKNETRIAELSLEIAESISADRERTIDLPLLPRRGHVQ